MNEGCSAPCAGVGSLEGGLLPLARRALRRGGGSGAAWREGALIFLLGGGELANAAMMNATSLKRVRRVERGSGTAPVTAGPCFGKQPCSSTRTGATAVITTAVTSIPPNHGHLPDRANLPLPHFLLPLTHQHPGHPASTFQLQKSKRLPRRSQLTSLHYQRIVLQTMTVKMVAPLRSHAWIVAALALPPCSPSFLLQRWLLQLRLLLSESLAVGRVLDLFSIAHPHRGLKTRPEYHPMLICRTPLK